MYFYSVSVFVQRVIRSRNQEGMQPHVCGAASRWQQQPEEGGASAGAQPQHQEQDHQVACQRCSARRGSLWRTHHGTGTDQAVGQAQGSCEGKGGERCCLAHGRQSEQRYEQRAGQRGAQDPPLAPAARAGQDQG